MSGSQIKGLTAGESATRQGAIRELFQARRFQRSQCKDRGEMLIK
jgi:hypothetical protein